MHRRIELDLARSIAIICMIVYHVAFDLSRMYGFEIPVTEGAWLVFARGTASLFLLLAGIGTALSHAKASTLSRRMRMKKHALRFLKIASAAVLVSVATYMANPETYVRFGILHLIAVGGALLIPLSRLQTWTIPLGVAVTLAGIALNDLTTDITWLLPLGIPPEAFRSVDYFPLLPWLGVMLVGYGIGYRTYVRTSRVSSFECRNFFLDTLAWPGRHSLLLYLIHQPIIIGILCLVLGKPSL